MVALKGKPDIGDQINKKVIEPLAKVYRLPSAIEEQEAIATILSDMGAELTSLETRLAKARQIKLGMMQELLTGRIRLV